MLIWYRRDGDEKTPGKKKDQIARYFRNCSHEDIQLLTPGEDLPPLPQAQPICISLPSNDDIAA
jgi:hypothetical protein